MTRKELLTVVKAVKHFLHYVYGRPVLVHTYNSAVSWIYKLRDPEGQMARWLQILGQYDLQITHRAGKKLGNADAMSRIPCKQCGREEEILEISDEEIHHDVRVITRQVQTCQLEELKENQGWMSGWEPSEFRTAQLADEDIGPIFTLKEGNQQCPVWSEVSHLGKRSKIL